MREILVIGESCLDVFVYCNADRLCPDVPVPVLKTVEQKENPGMALNVAANLLRLGKKMDVVTNVNWRDITKTRFVDLKSNHMFFRLDSDETMPHIDLRDVDLNEYECIVISDYNKGFLYPEDIERICSNHPLVFLDTKKSLDMWAEDAFMIKLNDYEWRKAMKYTQWRKDNVIHTAGAEGCYFEDEHFPVEKVEVKDVSGAGDTFMAALVAKYLDTKDIYESILFANECASEVVKHKGVTTL